MNKQKEIEKWWAFTFGCGQKHFNHYVKIKGTFSSTREEMFKLFGKRWSFQYEFNSVEFQQAIETWGWKELDVSNNQEESL
jgi:hypothetical protein